MHTVVWVNGAYGADMKCRHNRAATRDLCSQGGYSTAKSAAHLTLLLSRAQNIARKLVFPEVTQYLDGVSRK